MYRIKLNRRSRNLAPRKEIFKQRKPQTFVRERWEVIGSKVGNDEMWRDSSGQLCQSERHYAFSL